MASPRELVDLAFPDLVGPLEDINTGDEAQDRRNITRNRFINNARKVAENLAAQGLSDEQIVATLQNQLDAQAAEIIGAKLQTAFEPFGGLTGVDGGEGDAGDGTLTPEEILARLGQDDPLADFLTPEQLAGFGLTPEQANEAVLRQFGLRPPGGGDAPASSQAALQNAATAAATLQNLISQQPGQNILDTRAQATDEARLGVQGFGAQSADVIGRSGASTAASGAFRSIADLVARAGEAQARLGLDIASTPRNIFPAFFLSQGQDPSSSLFEMFNLSNLLGVDTSQFMSIIGSSVSAAQQAQDLAATSPTIDISTLVSGDNITQQANVIRAEQEAAGAPPLVEQNVVPEETTFERPVSTTAPVTAPLPGAPTPAPGAAVPASAGAGGISTPGTGLTAPGGGPVGALTFEELMALLNAPPPGGPR